MNVSHPVVVFLDEFRGWRFVPFDEVPQVNVAAIVFRESKRFFPESIKAKTCEGIGSREGAKTRSFDDDERFV